MCLCNLNHIKWGRYRIIWQRISLDFCWGGPYLNITEHFHQIMTATAQRQMIQNILIHKFDVGVSQFNCAIGISVYFFQG